MIKFLVCFSGIGNILLFLTKYFQVGQVSFLRILPSEAANSGGKNKVASSPTFIIMTEVYYEDDLLDTLLEFVQSTRVGRNTGHLGIYLRNDMRNWKCRQKLDETSQNYFTINTYFYIRLFLQKKNESIIDPNQQSGGEV